MKQLILSLTIAALAGCFGKEPKKQAMKGSHYQISACCFWTAAP
ncbi:hypothetical protein [Paraflavitalea speifideaquila]|nr:hypothetical protein [Paraflavitalea speifideiaquila]